MLREVYLLLRLFNGNGSGGVCSGDGVGGGKGSTSDTGRGISLAARVPAAGAALGESSHTATGIGAGAVAEMDMTTNWMGVTKLGHTGLPQASFAVGAGYILNDVLQTVVDSLDTVTQVNTMATPNVTVGITGIGNESVSLVSIALVAMTLLQPRNVGPFGKRRVDTTGFKIPVLVVVI